MKLSINFALPFLFSAVLHAAAAGLATWGDGSDSNSVPSQIWLDDVPSTTSGSVSPKRPRPPTSNQPNVTSAQPTLTSTHENQGSIESEAPSTDVATNDFFDLNSQQTNPYFARLRRYLSDVKRGLVADEGHAEQFSIQIAVMSSGEVTSLRIEGNESRLKEELTERMARIGFLPALPNEILFGKQEIKIRYQALFSR